MTYLLHRIKESRGFIARRAQWRALWISAHLYGMSAVHVRDGQILTPEMIYKEGGSDAIKRESS
jgi:hypothetical protein